MAKFEVRMKPQGDTLEAYMESTKRVSFIMGPLGSGKTYQSCQKIFRLMCQQEANAQGLRKSRWYAVRNTYPDLTSTTIKDWMELFGEFGKFKHGGMEPPTHHLRFHLEDGTTVVSELVFLALDRPDSIKKLRGAQVTGFWLNEVKELQKAVVDMADLRHGRYPSAMDGGPTWHGMIGDTNAPDQDHWYYTLEEEAPEGWAFFRQSGGVVRSGIDGVGRVKWKPNPNAENLNNLPEGYYINGMAGKSDAWISVNLANEYGVVFDGKPVFPEYNDHLVVNEDIRSIDKRVIDRGWDFGLTPACIYIQITAEPRILVLDELVAEDMGAERFSEQVLHHSQMFYHTARFEDVGDPAGAGRSEADEKTAFQMLMAKDIDIQPGTQTLLARLESVRYALTHLVNGRPMLQIHPRCKMIRKALQGGYQYKRVQVANSDRYHDTPDKNKYSHPMDALEYAVAKHIWPIIAKRYDKNQPNPNQSYQPATAAGY